MNDWLLHMTEDQRTYAVGLIDAMLAALSTASHLPLVRCDNWSRATVRLLADRRSGASVALSRGRVILRTPLSVRRNRLAAEITGPASASSDDLADGDVAVMLVTLADWRAALSSPVTTATTEDVQGIERAALLLLRGVAHAHRPNWEMAALQSSRQEGHVLQIYSRRPDGSQLGCRFKSRPMAPCEGGMTRELVGEIERILGERSHAHVVELERWKRYRMCFEATPNYCVSPTRDPMTTLRALNALPSGVRLTTSRSRPSRGPG